MSKNKYFHFFGDKKLSDLLTREEIIAIQKTSKGSASEYDQKLAYQTIIQKICRVPCSAFNENQAIQSFNEGVRYVGQMLAIAHVADIDTFKDFTPIASNINNKLTS